MSGVARRRLAAIALIAVATSAAGVDRASALPVRPAPPRSPAGPPLAAGSLTGGSGGAEAEASAEGAGEESDPLVTNGLGSPSCRGGLGPSALSARERDDCETSGFVAASAPTGDFGIDVHIDTGVLGLSSGGLLASVQDLCVTPVWMALVWAVHALVVMLEWCFTIDLLDSRSVDLGVARALRSAQATFTVPWLAVAFTLGAVVLAYDGLVRRRVGESLGHVALALALTAAGLSVMLDPVGTVGATGDWANEASLGALAAPLRGSPSEPAATLDDAMRTVFAAVIEGPWCYLEFGDVGWCRNPRRLDPRLRAAALALAHEDAARIGCGARSSDARECEAAGSTAASALARSVRLLRAARTNGAIFLALPANDAGRNSINDSSSLLRAICRSEDATRCQGPSASEAQFRTNRGTWPRVGGLLLIVVGALGMLLLLGFLALRLLASALFSLLYLLLAPLVALAPALGESGRVVFRKWGVALASSLLSKLLFAFVLGAVLTVLGVLLSLEALGWWTQWLLMSAFWWAAFLHRNDVLALAEGRAEHGRPSDRVARRFGSPRAVRRRALDRVRDAKERLSRRGLDESVESTPRRLAPAGRAVLAGDSRRASDAPERSSAVDPQVRRLVEADVREARSGADARDTAEQRVSEVDARLARIAREHENATTLGDRRRVASLDVRRARLEAELGASHAELARAARFEGDAHTTTSLGSARERAHFLDRQAMLPAAGAPRAAGSARGGARGGRDGGERRDYAALAGLVGRGPREYERLAPNDQRATRVAIDRELALRRERLLVNGVDDPTAATGRQWTPPPSRGAASRPGRSSGDEPPSILDDARAVAEGRKRQLGIGQP